MMEGAKLYECLFEDYEPYELEEHDDVSCYEESLAYHDGWYIVTDISFRYRGKKYTFQRKDHSSDNVCDTEYLIHTFREVNATNVLEQEIDRIIGNIESETCYNSFEDIVRELEGLKQKFNYLIEVN
ncbi:hypothetical protein [Bacillus cereus]|uniref:IDEAL domain-containing protein n=1 Tax=Bacillus cereus TaxID=1396 RepID=A0ABD4LLG6_BACCE|nr:hypothetical protein [Bacillus cereus]MBK1611702.1 hypothetical protein [Bacillus cereus]